jgi:exopolysaccharide biosynthesis polyprenyl glycosylphosphotransferase
LDLPDHRESERTPAERLLPIVFGVTLAAIDLTLVVCAYLLAYWARFTIPEAEATALGREQYLWMGLAVGIVTTAIFALHGLYDEERRLSWPTRSATITSALSTALVLTVAVSFFLGDQRFSRLWFIAGWAFAVLALIAWRTVADALYVAIRGALTPANRVLIVGANAMGRELARVLAADFRVLGYVDNGADLDTEDLELPLLGTVAQLERLVQMHAVDEVVVALPEDRREQICRVIARGFRRRVHVKLPPELGALLPAKCDVHQIAGRPYLGFALVARVTWIKRATDLLLSAAGLALLSPLFAVIAVAIRLDSPGPAFYRQMRVGRDGRRFPMLKFRSMRQDAEQLLEALRDSNEASGPLFKMRHDPRITRVGRFLRRLSLDELPQLINVLNGQMSLVGPRPPIPAEVEQYQDWEFARLRAVPGITGLWQVNGRSEVPFHDMVRLDLHYIRNWSLSMDIEILMRTIPAVLTNRGAY